MRCFKPIRLNQPDIYRGTSYSYVPCGKCEACLSNKRREWLYRLRRENLMSTSGDFVTLTYDDDHLPRDGLLCKKHVQDFLKRFRKLIYPYKIRYFIVGEYGEQFGRPHYHMLLFNLPRFFDLKGLLIKSWTLCSPTQWSMPNVIGEITDASINYCAKYCVSNSNEVPYKFRTFMLSSRKPGIGGTISIEKLSSHMREGTLTNVIRDVGGYPLLLPRYYSDKIFNEEEKVELKEQLIEHEREQECKWRERYGTRQNAGIQQIAVNGQRAQKVKRTAKKYVSPYAGLPLPKTKSEEAKLKTKSAIESHIRGIEESLKKGVLEW